MIVGRAGRCPRCDTVHGAGARFCSKCGLDFTSPEAGELDAQRRSSPRQVLAGERHSSASIAKVAGMVWLAVGAVTILGAAGELATGGQIGTWAAISAVLELLTGFALFLAPSWEMLTASMLWGILSVIGAFYSTLFGTPPKGVGLLLIAGIAIATLLSWLGRRPLPVPEGLGRGGSRDQDRTTPSPPADDATAERR